MIAGTAIAGAITGTVAAGIKATADLDEQMSNLKPPQVQLLKMQKKYAD